MAIGYFAQNGRIFLPICMILNNIVAAQDGDANNRMDEAIAHWQPLIRECGYDPLIVKSFHRAAVSYSNCVIIGLSTIRRIGNVTLNETESFVNINMNIGIDLLSGKCNCEARGILFTAKGTVLSILTNFMLSGHIEQYAGNKYLPHVTSLAIVDGGKLITHFEGKGIFGTLFQWFGQNHIHKKVEPLMSNPSDIKQLLNQALSSVCFRKI